MKHITVICIALLLSACSTVGQEALMMKGDDWPPLDITKSQLLTELGRPNSSTLSLVDSKSTETLAWVYAHAESNPALLSPWWVYSWLQAEKGWL